MSKEIKVILVSLSIVLALGICFQSGYYLGVGEEDTTTADDPYLASVEEAWDRIVEKYVENDTIDYELLSQYAIEGMLDYIDDPHSVYLDPETYALDEDDTAGSYYGIGVLASVVDENTSYLVFMTIRRRLRQGCYRAILYSELTGLAQGECH
jgi:carboxyl-terminal processing protease